tara:strand:+ start:1775 stop:2080 length:306 start_codon:yes stop_codon:yes gene_type:complete
MKIDIGGHNYSIKTMKNQTTGKEGNMLLGRHDVKECEIYLDEDMTHSRTVETFMHEILHVILTNTGNSHDEGLIDGVSNGLLQLGVADYLWKKAKNSKTSK